MVIDTDAAAATGMNHPHYLTSNGVRLLVADNDHRRVLAFNTNTTNNGASAHIVLR